MNTVQKMLACCWLLIHCSGCATAGVERTPFSSWSRQSFDKLGLSVTLPQQPDHARARYFMDLADSDQYEKNTGRKDLLLCFHPVWSGSFLSEPIYLMKIRILVFRQGKADGYTTKAFPKKLYRDLSSTNGVVHQRGQEVKCKFFRKDLLLADDRKVICEAEVVAPQVGSNQYTADTNAIARVFMSIRNSLDSK